MPGMTAESVSAKMSAEASPQAGSSDSADASASDVLEALKQDGELDDSGDDPDAAESGEPAGDEPAGEEKEGDEPEEGPDADDDQPEEKQAKESTYQKQKRKLERAREELAQERQRFQQMEAERLEWQEENAQWRTLFEQERKAREADLRRFEDAGFKVDPREVELERAQRQLAELQMQAELAQQRAQAAPQMERERQVQEYKRQLYTESADIAEEAGLDQRQLLRAFVFAVDVEGRKDATLQAVANELTSRRQGSRDDGLRAQARANQSAPRTVRGVSPTSVRRPSAEDTPEEIVNQLRAEGVF